uniref:Glycine N-acyltransferase-like protein n=1 Tax=Sus scrofa TaxID=9823 RepID=A0A8D1GTJ0_PIG
FALRSSQTKGRFRKCLPAKLCSHMRSFGYKFFTSCGVHWQLQLQLDPWPVISSFIYHPTKQEMTDDFDHHTNTYQIYSKDLKNCHEALSTSDVINWKQHLQIQSSQPSLDEVIQNLATTKFIKVKQTQRILYITPEMAIKLLPSLPETKNLPPGYSRPKARLFQVSSMDVTHAALVNKFWHFGGNERSQRFIERCIRNFLSICLLGPEGTPISWSLMDQTGEIRMGATLPEYRGQGLISNLLCVHIQALDERGFPTYMHTDKANKTVQKINHNLHHIPFPCGWNQWNCVPL